MSITDEILRLQQAKKDIGDAIVAKGGNVSGSINTYAQSILDIPDSISIDELSKLLDEKQDKLESGKSLKTINEQSLLGSGNIEIQIDESKINTEIYIGTGTPPEDAKIAINPNVDLIPIVQSLGDSPNKVPSQKAVNDALATKIGYTTDFEPQTIIVEALLEPNGGYLYAFPSSSDDAKFTADTILLTRDDIVNNADIGEGSQYAVMSQRAVTNQLNTKVDFDYLTDVDQILDETNDYYAKYLNCACDGGLYFYDSSLSDIARITCDDGKISFNRSPIGNIGDPVANTDAATKAYVDSHSSNIDYATDIEIDNIFA